MSQNANAKILKISRRVQQVINPESYPVEYDMENTTHILDTIRHLITENKDFDQILYEEVSNASELEAFWVDCLSFFDLQAQSFISLNTIDWDYICQQLTDDNYNEIVDNSEQNEGDDEDPQ